MAKKKIKKSPFELSRAAETEFARALRKVARVSGNLVESYVDGATLLNSSAMSAALRAYAATITPWAKRQSLQLVSRTDAKNKKAWEQSAKIIGKTFRMNMAEGNVGAVSAQLVKEQVALITSIPLEAGERAQKLSMEAVLGGKRPDEVAKELSRTTEVTESRAMLIARTESARSAAAINEARATSIGSRQYIWRTMGDGDVRESHAEMDGTVHSWDNPPTLSDGTTTHPGGIYNCRCYAEPILPD